MPAARSDYRVTLEDLGGGVDKTSAKNCVVFADPRARGATINLGDSAYEVNCTIELTPVDGAKRTAHLVGNGRDRAALVNTTANQPTLRVPAYAQCVRIVGVTLDRALAAARGGDGVLSLDGISHVTLRKVTSRRNRNGFNPGHHGYRLRREPGSGEQRWPWLPADEQRRRHVG